MIIVIYCESSSTLLHLSPTSAASSRTVKAHERRRLKGSLCLISSLENNVVRLRAIIVYVHRMRICARTLLCNPFSTRVRYSS